MVKRLITSAVGIAIAITVLYFSDTWALNAAVAVVSVIMTHELLGACKCLESKWQAAMCFLFAAGNPFMFETVENGGMTLTYMFASICIFGMFAGFIRYHKKIRFEKICVMLATTLILSASMTCIVSLRRLSDLHGVCYVVLALAGAWLGDSGAYFVGTFLGKHKLCPEISPKKTVEGAIGGILTTPLVFAAYAFCYHYVQVKIRGSIDFGVNYPALILVGIACGILGIVGDLSASLLKRQYNVKDFGSIMPGHGGLMDRFDSVLFVLPFMTFIMNSIDIFNYKLVVLL